MAVICANGVHDSICTNQSDGVQDERRDGTRQIHASDQAAAGYHPAIASDRQDIGKRCRADGFHRPHPAFLAQCQRCSSNFATRNYV